MRVRLIQFLFDHKLTPLRQLPLIGIDDLFVGDGSVKVDVFLLELTPSVLDVVHEHISLHEIVVAWVKSLLELLLVATAHDSVLNHAQIGKSDIENDLVRPAPFQKK